MPDLLDEFNARQLTAQLRKANRQGREWALIDETRRDQLSPEYVAELRDYLQSQAHDPNPELYQLQHEPISLTTVAGARLTVFDNKQAAVSGELVTFDGSLRLTFSSYEIAIDRCFSASTPSWREWMHKKFGNLYRTLEQSAKPGDRNVTMCMSPLYHASDRFGDSQAVVRNTVVLLIWNDTSISARLIADKNICKARLRMSNNNDTSYSGSFKG